MRGADLLVMTLADAGIKTIFSLSGNQIMPVYDACIDAGIRIIHTRHEGAAVFMADAWAQLTGEPGIALVTAAPGFGNALGALYTARAAESPVVFLSGDSARAQDGRGAFQEMDQVSASVPFTKLSLRARSTATLGADMARAIDVARSGRAGPVHLALPFDVVQADAGGADIVKTGEETSDAPAPGDVADVVAAIAETARPVILLGPQNSTTRVPHLASRLQDALDVPVVVMESPRGLNDPALGRLGALLAQADLIVSLGKRVDFTLAFGDEAKFAPDCRWIVIDAEDGQLERARTNLGARLSHRIRAAAQPFAQALIASNGSARGRGEWKRTCTDLLAARNFSTAEAVNTETITALTISRAVLEAMRDAALPLLISDGGEFGQWAQAALPVENRLINGPAGAIGGGLCYAIGAKVARPDATIFTLMGDGTAGFHFAEFETAVREKLPFVAVIGNDRRWNAEHQIQLRDYGAQRLIGCDLSGARYDLAVAGLGGHGEHVTRRDELLPALRRAVASGLPACVNIEMEGLAAPIVAGH